MSRVKHEENLNSSSRKEEIYNNCKRWRKTNQVALMYSRAKNRAKNKGIEFTIKKEDVVIPDRCPLLDIPFTNTYLNPKDNRDYVPSLDRIDNSKGYVPGNVWVISFLANRMKNTATHQELLTFGKNYKDIIQFN